MEPLVSVVIPTYQRPELVKRAVNSALNQTLSQIEVIVVINGGDGEPTQRSLAEIADPRLRIIQLPVNLGNASPARNAGCEAAQAKWVAHLDDDDEWMPEKLERQYEAATRSAYNFPIVSHYLTAKTSENEDYILPRRSPSASEHISEYLFVRRSSYHTFGDGLLQGSTLFTAKELMLKVPFGTNAYKHDDWDWVLRACAVEGAGVEFVSEVLSIWHSNGQLASMTRTHDWQRTLDWIRSVRNLVTPRAYASFLLTEVASDAVLNPSWHGFSLLLRESIRLGKPRPIDYCLFFGVWFVRTLIPGNLRGWLRSLLTEKRSLKSEPTI